MTNLTDAYLKQLRTKLDTAKLQRFGEQARNAHRSPSQRSSTGSTWRSVTTSAAETYRSASRRPWVSAARTVSSSGGTACRGASTCTAAAC